MEPKTGVFKDSGPHHLTDVDWENPDHRRSIAASLVQGAYSLERDHQKKNRSNAIFAKRESKETESLAPPWWESFNFKLMRQLIDKNDRSIYGAIFESNFPIPPHRGNPPKFVIAFRGTIANRKTGVQDLNLDINIFFNVLNKRSRAKHAIKVVEEIIDGTPPDDHPNIWLAGHSFGSALALQAGRNLVIEKGVCLETYLFNPPIASLPIERIKNNLLKKASRVVTSFGEWAGSMALEPPRQDDDVFEKLCEWKPHMFVNPRDAICAEYIGFFNNRDTMDEIGALGIEKVSAKVSILSLLFKAVGRDLEQSHLIPSVYLNINKENTKKRAHGLEQWWQPNIDMWTKLYEFEGASN